MKKTFKLLLIAIVLGIFMTGCTKTKSYTFKVETGDNIKIELNMKNKYNITSDTPFKITKDKETVCQGDFYYLDAYNKYEELIEENSDVELIEESTKDGNKYMFWNYIDKEYDFAIKIKESNTVILMGSTISEKQAKECFDLLKFTKEN